MPVQTQTPPRATKQSSPTSDQTSTDVDLAGPWTSVRRFWWLVVLIAVAVTAAAAIRAGSAPRLFRATTTLYVGQPLSPQGYLMSTSSAKAATAIEIAMGDESVSKAAKAANTTPANIRSGLSAVAVVSPLASKLANPPELLRISLKLKNASAANRAVAAIGEVVMDHTNEYAEDKIASLKEELKAHTEAKALSDKQFADASKQVAAHPTGVEAAVWLSLMQTITVDRRQATTDLAQSRNELRLAEEIELTQVQSEPAAIRETAASKRPTIAVALLLGVGLGVVAAVIAGAVTDRRRKAS